MKKNESEFFVEFWNVWKPHQRKTDGRGLARDTFNKHVKNGADPRDIIDGAKCFFRTMKDKDREFVPLSQTWLNRESYADLAEQERAHQERLARVQTEQPARQERRVILSANHFMNRAANAN